MAISTTHCPLDQGQPLAYYEATKPEFNNVVGKQLPICIRVFSVNSSKTHPKPSPTNGEAPAKPRKYELLDPSSKDDSVKSPDLSVDPTLEKSKESRVVKHIGESARYTVVAVIMLAAFYLLREKLSDIKWSSVLDAMRTVSPISLLIAVGITASNFLLLTGYDLIAVRYLRKSIAVRRVMAGAVVGYAMSNVFGWTVGGTAVRYRLYSKWGFSLVEIVAFISIISMTFWLGMFLLAGIAFVALPVQLPEKFASGLLLSPSSWGWIFLGVVMLYLLASIFIRKPVHWHEYRFALPPFKLSAMQLVVSAGDFVLASAVLYFLIPSDLRGHDAIHFSTVLVAYLAAMIGVVITHSPGGVVVLELIVLEMTPDTAQEPVLAALLLYRVIYYLVPAFFAGLLWMYIEWFSPKDKAVESKPT